MERLAHNHPEDTSELLSAYVDNEVTVVERRRAEELVQSCTACAQEVRELQLFKELLHDVPTVQPRRSFTIDPQRAPRPRWLLFPTFRFATVIATVLLLVVLGVDALGSRNFGAAGGATSTTSAGGEERAFSALQLPQSAAAAASGAPDAAGGAEPPQIQAQAPASTAASAAASAEASAAASAPAPESATAPDAAAGSTASAAPTAISNAAAEAGDNAAANSPAESAAGGTTSQLQANEPLSPDTLATKQAEDSAQTAPVDTLLIAEIALAVLAIGFGAAALWAWRRGA